MTRGIIAFSNVITLFDDVYHLSFRILDYGRIEESRRICGPEGGGGLLSSETRSAGVGGAEAEDVGAGSAGGSESACANNWPRG